MMKNKQRLLRLISGILCVLMLFPCFAVSVADAADSTNNKYVSVNEDGTQNAILAMGVLRVTQSLHDGNAIDLGGSGTGRSWLMAPFDCVVKRVYKTENCNALFIQSQKKVRLANGDSSFVTVLLIHMNDLSGFKVGDKFKQGEKLYLEGDHGYATGNHIHFEAGLGKFSGKGWHERKDGSWSINNSTDPTEIFYVSRNHTTVVRTGGLDWELIDTGDNNPIVLATPTAKIENKASNGKPRLTWNTIEGAEEYQVYRATSKNGTYKKMYTTTGTSYTNTSAETGKRYYYKVRAVAQGVYSGFSEIVSRTCDCAQPKVTVANVASTGKIKLTWDKVDGAVKYEVYRATSKNGTYELLKTTTGTSFTNTSATAGKTYYYKVKAIAEKSAANSAYSEVVTRTCDLARPKVTIKLSSKGKPALSWEKISGAVKYEVWRATSKNGTYELIKTVTGTSFTNTSATAGKTYYYKVKAIAEKSAANSAYSEVKYIKAK